MYRDFTCHLLNSVHYLMDGKKIPELWTVYKDALGLDWNDAVRVLRKKTETFQNTFNASKISLDRKCYDPSQFYKDFYGSSGHNGAYIISPPICINGLIFGKEAVFILFLLNKTINPIILFNLIFVTSHYTAYLVFSIECYYSETCIKRTPY